MSQRALFLMHHTPWAGWIARERLDLLLMALAFEMEVRVAFVGDGVWQLLAGQGLGPGENRDFTAGYKSLDMYGVSGVFADAEALHERGLTTADLSMTVECLNRADLRRLISEQDVLL